MPPPNKPKQPDKPPLQEDTDPGAPVDMLQTGEMRAIPRKPPPPVFGKKPAPAPAEETQQPAAGDRTLVYDQNRGRPAGQGARLIFTAGPRAGSEVDLPKDETTLGRGTENSIVIP